MLERLFPKNRDFFPNFEALSSCLTEATVELLKSVESQQGRIRAPQRTRQLESKANELVRESIDHLRLTFVTPFDRSHIFRLLVAQSEIISTIRLLSEKIEYFDVPHFPLESIEMVLQCGRACSLMREMIGEIKKIRDTDRILKLCLEMYEIATQSNRLAFEATKSFEFDMHELLKIREINRDLVSIAKRFESIAFLIEEIILEYA